MPAKRSTASSGVNDYIATHPPKVRAILTRIRRTVRKAVPEATETISYQMPTFTLNGVLVHFAAFTGHIGLYPPVRGDASLLKAAAPYANEKGNLRFPFDEPIPYDLITRIVLARAALNLAKPGRRSRN
jgi:uncharacterized protein YdhG (YjbR/CyaY superfamily)